MATCINNLGAVLSAQNKLGEADQKLARQLAEESEENPFASAPKKK